MRLRRRVVAFLWNADTRRPRLPWRIVAALVVLALLSLALTVADPLLRVPVETLLGLVATSVAAAAAARNVAFVASQAVVYVGAVYLVGRFVDRRRFRDFGLHLDREWWTDLGFGLALGAALMTGIFLVELAAGWVVVTGTFRIAQTSFSFAPWFAWSVVTFAVIGVTEELLTRGYLIKNLAEGLTWFDRVGPDVAVGLAVLASSAVFAVGHAANPNASLASVAGILLAAFMLAAGYVLTGELAIPIGVHVTWNFFQGSVYGFPVSGLDFGLSLLAISQQGPPLVTGGTFGPEAGILGVLASAVGIGLILAWVRWREGVLRVDPSLTTPDLRGVVDGGDSEGPREAPAAER